MPCVTWDHCEGVGGVNRWSMNGGWCDMMVWVLFMLVTWYGFVFLTNSLMRFNEMNGKYFARVWMFSCSSLDILWLMSVKSI